MSCIPGAAGGGEALEIMSGERGKAAPGGLFRSRERECLESCAAALSPAWMFCHLIPAVSAWFELWASN